MTGTGPSGARRVIGPGRLLIGAGQASGAGNNTLLTPVAGFAIRVHYASYNPAADAEIGFRFGAAGNIWLRNNVIAKSVIAKDFGDLRFIQGEPNEALILNLSAGTVTDWTVFYLEVN